MKKFISLFLVAVLCLMSVPDTAIAAVKINKKNITLDVGKSTALKITGTTKSAKWTSNNKEVATVTSGGKVTAVAVGKATITATVNKKKYTCKITVNGGYGEGSYKVGKNIPEGEYVLFATSSYGAYFSINSDSSGVLDSIIVNDNFNYNSIVTIADGTYLELSRCYAVPIGKAKVDTSGEGMFRVGTHLDVGEYEIISTSDIGAYIEVSSDSTHEFNSIVSNDNFNNNKYITIEDGQYLTISRGKLNK